MFPQEEGRDPCLMAEGQEAVEEKKEEEEKKGEAAVGPALVLVLEGLEGLEVLEGSLRWLLTQFSFW
jgi:hypothetical protein